MPRLLAGQASRVPIRKQLSSAYASQGLLLSPRDLHQS